ncbi:hypothetical protein FHG87_019395 [Trinorchestia longiramus]|nr:hypothetical protein FHG87_019395 [Trinorchestia longiramus]
MLVAELISRLHNHHYRLRIGSISSMCFLMSSYKDQSYFSRPNYNETSQFTLRRNPFNSVSQSGPYRPPGGVEEMKGGGRRVRLEWGACITV